MINRRLQFEGQAVLRVYSTRFLYFQYMKNTLLSIALLANSFLGQAQEGLQQFNKERLHINQTAFTFLSGWAVANLGTGLIGQASAVGETKYFRQMNAIWGGVTLLIAVPAYINARKGGADLSLDASVRAQSAIEKTFILNAGLDIAYLAGSAWFLEKANTSTNPDKYRGFGKSVLVQGGFLLVFDAIMFVVHNQHSKKLYELLNGLQLSPGSIGFNVRL